MHGKLHRTVTSQAIGAVPVPIDLSGLADLEQITLEFQGDHTELVTLVTDGGLETWVPAAQYAQKGPMQKATAPTQIKAAGATTITYSIWRVLP